MPKMTSPRAKGKKVAVLVSSKIKKETDGIKGDYEKPDDVESTLKMMIRQAHEIHKRFYKRNQGLRKSQSFEHLKNKNQTDLPRVSHGKGDVGSIKENIPHKKKLKDPVKLGKIVKAPLSVKTTNKKIRKNPSKDTKVEIRKPTSASSLVSPTNGKKIKNDLGDKPSGKVGPVERKVEKSSQNDVKILFEKELKKEDENSGKNFSENRTLSPEELLLNINKIWEERNQNLENFSKTDAKFIEGLLEIAKHKVSKKDQGNVAKQEKPEVPLKNSQNSKNSPKELEEIWRKDENKEEEEEEEIFSMAIGEPAQELKSYRELKSFVNDELLRIWKPFETVEKDEKELKKPKVEELKPGRIIVKPNPTSYLEKRALYAKTNFTSFISKLDQEKKNLDDKIKDSKIVKRLENAFETLNSINWENSSKTPEKVSRVKEEDLAKSILQRIDDHEKVIVGEINKTEQKIHEKFNLGKKKPKTKVEGDKSLEIHFKRSLEDVQSADGLLLETEKACQEITQKIFDEYRNKKFQENNSKEARYKLDSIDRKIQKDFKKFGLINFKKTNRIKLRDKGPEKVSECSGWRKKKSQPSRSISRSIGSAGGTDNQGLPPISLQDETVIPGKLITDAKPLDTGTGFDQNKVLRFADKAEETEDNSFDQVLDIDDGWDETLEDPGGSTINPEVPKPIFVDLEELKYRKGDPSFRYYKRREDDEFEEKKLTSEEMEAMRRKRELQSILAMDKDYVVDDDDKGKKTSRKSKDLSVGKCGGHRMSIIVNHITSGERIDDNEKVLGHASKLVVKEDKEKKKMMTQCYYKQGMRRATEPAIPQSQFSGIDVLRKNTRRSEPINITRTESRDVECQTDTSDTSDDDMDLYSLENESIN